MFEFKKNSEIGRVYSVDTAVVIIKVDNLNKLKKLQVNQLVVVQSSKAGQNLIGIVNKIARKSFGEIQGDMEEDTELLIENTLKVNLIGTLIDKYGSQENIFKRTLHSVPEIDAKCYQLEGNNITKFMSIISAKGNYETPLSLGRYSIDENAEAFLDGDKLFQRHAVIVGSTGSGKSWSVAKIVEQIAKLPMANAILFDIHGEYSSASFKTNGIQQLKIANPNDLTNSDKLDNGILMLPYWLLTYEEMLAMLLDRSDNNAPNQAMIFSKTVFEKKQDYLDSIDEKKLKANITVDSPIPYKLQDVIDRIKEFDEERVPGSRGDKAGPFNGKLTRFLQRLDAKNQDKRLGFLFSLTDEELQLDWLNNLLSTLMAGSANIPNHNGVKIIDFSEVPSDVLPLVIGLVARLIFTVQQWSENSERHPISLLCDEAHLYIPEKVNQDTASTLSLMSFERIAKEGRKYGVSLTVTSQRPSEVNKTVLSQCNNFISLRLSNAEDQSVIKKLLPDSLAGLTDILPVLDVGEALVVGDSSLLPTRVLIDEPTIKPDSATIKFWEKWSKDKVEQNISKAVSNLRQQSKS